MTCIRPIKVLFQGTIRKERGINLGEEKVGVSQKYLNMFTVVQRQYINTLNETKSSSGFNLEHCVWICCYNSD